ncbi:unnamed protein product [Porites evermanni]|uniref:Uncharacterized protein n=1 Tax=Porites evermanni TaxID=104178 RepID=A0ABN8N8A2_9CNID|nr:unnamed protein product [Porites evermanni]
MAGCFLSVQALFLTCLFWGAWLSCIASANQDALRSVNLTSVVGEGDLESCWQTWKDLFLAAVKDNIPTKRLRGRNPVPWLTGAVINLIKKEETVRRKLKLHPSESLKVKFQTLRSPQSACYKRDYFLALNVCNGLYTMYEVGSLYCFLSFFLDLDECKDKTHQCDVNANCTNIPGSYNCKCRLGYTENGSICNEIDECKDGSHDCHINANCTNIPGSYNCTCRPGYQGNGSICKDIDECEKRSHDCHKNANCTNIPGSYNCTCRPGYTGNGNICKDIDECEKRSHDCHKNANCTNIPGSYNCTCRPGYTGNGTICNDIDECEKGSHDCHINANCTNTPGSYNCTCRPGYTGNGRFCKDLDECKNKTHQCDVNANCTNIPGSYNCTCRPGYTGNGSICNDIDECENGSHDCQKNANCTNTAGSYNCTCRPGYTGNGSICKGGLNASIILGNDSRYLENLTLFLEPVINSSVRSRFVRCWHAKEDGWAASTFHGNCDDKGPTVTIIQVGSFIFGGYSSCWLGDSSKAFIYSLTNNNGSGHAVYNPVKLRVKPDRYKDAVGLCGKFGPYFGLGDIVISNNAASNQHSHTYCGDVYPLPPGYSLSGLNCKFYAGSSSFTPTDIEVFYETTT